MVKNFDVESYKPFFPMLANRSGKKAELISKKRERIISDPNRPAIFVNKVQELYSYGQWISVVFFNNISSGLINSKYCNLNLLLGHTSVMSFLTCL